MWSGVEQTEHGVRHQPGIGLSERRLELGLKLGADHVVNARQEDAVAAVRRITGGKGVQFVV